MYYFGVPAPRSSVPPVIRLLADPVRWRLMRELASGDQRVRELVTALGQPQNLVSYHLRQLREGGLVTSRRSSFDGRDTYYSLDLDGCSRALADAATALHPGLALASGAGAAPRSGTTLAPGATLTPDATLAPDAIAGPAPGQRTRRVLFVCTGNSSRSPMAEALLRHRARMPIQAASAGIRPKPVHPKAAAVMRDRYHMDISRHRPTHVEAVADQRFDYVISLCDKAREACPEFSGDPRRVHWSLPDPAADGGGQAAYAAFERTAAELDTRIRFLLPVLSA
jgi:ArsR family transcriptional regulator, arsenate/arsenite/antimonite-responsive transcriptional repressor / arsenate reductase (thioredoxin)